MCENYQKRSQRNRYDIVTSHGKMTLTIPLQKGKNQQMPISDVLIAYDEDWIDKHLHAIKSAYGRSPFFEYYFDDLAVIFQKKVSHLTQLNHTLHLWFIAKTKLDVTVEQTQTYIKQYENGLDLRGNSPVLSPTNKVTYVQVWQEKFGFIPNMSILDLLFCEGPNTKNVLAAIAKSI